MRKELDKLRLNAIYSDRQTDRQNKSVLFCYSNQICIAFKGAARLRFFRGRDAPFNVAIKQALTDDIERKQTA